MVYATVSKGFRPGGLNRRLQPPPLPPLARTTPDFLTNYEIGYKTSWLDNHLRFNGAFFWEDWKDFQFGFLGPNSFTIVRNAGSARIKGAEQQIEWAPVQGLNVSLAATELDAKLTKDFCLDVDPNGVPLPLTGPNACIPSDADPLRDAAADRRRSSRAMPRSAIPSRSAVTTDTCRRPMPTRAPPTRAWRRSRTQLIGSLPAYGTLDLTAGIGWNNFTLELFADNALDKRAETDRFAECTHPDRGRFDLRSQADGDHQRPAHHRHSLRTALLGPAAELSDGGAPGRCTAVFLRTLFRGIVSRPPIRFNCLSAAAQDQLA